MSQETDLAPKSSSAKTESTPRKSNGGQPPAVSPRGDRTKSEVHIILQGKGGVGKTLVASLLVQFFAERGEKIIAFDTDPENRTFSDLKYVKATPLPIKDSETDEINFRELDKLVSKLVEEPSVYIIDNGAGSFGAMSSYLVQGNGLTTLLEEGVAVILHIVIATGPEYDTTLHGAASVLDTASGAPSILWVNERNGTLADQVGDDRLEETAFYDEYKAAIRGIVTLRALKKPASDNFAAMLARGLSFAEAEKDAAFFIPEKSRLRRIKADVFEQITVALTETV